MQRIVSIAAAIFSCLLIVTLALSVLTKNQKNEKDKLEAQMNATQTTVVTTTNIWDYINSQTTTTAPDNSGLQQVTESTTTTAPAVTTFPEIEFIG